MTIYERKNIRRNIFFIYYYEEDILVESSDFSDSITNICLTISGNIMKYFPGFFRIKKERLQYANKHTAVRKNYNFPYVGIIQIG